MVLNYGNGENVWMHPPVHRILGWYSRPSNLNLKRNVWRLNQITQIIDNEIYVKGDPAISDLATLNRFPTLIEANLININGSKIGVIAEREEMKIVTKKMISMLSLILFINLKPFKEMEGLSPPNSRVSAKLIGERSADINYYTYL